MRRIFVFVILLALVACTRPSNQDAIKSKISSYKKQVNELNARIADLEKQLSSMDPELSVYKVPVILEQVSPQTFDHFIEVSGSAEAVNAAVISPQMNGLITDILVVEGDNVQKGQLLARLNSEVTENTIAEVQGSLDLATTVYEKQKRLWDQGIGSEIQYLNAKNGMEALQKKMETLESQLDMSLVKSPVTGIVDEIYKKKGELAIPGVPMMQVVNLGEIYINADISESYLAKVKEGDLVKVSFPVYPGMVVETPIWRKGNVINPSNRTFEIHLKLNNPEGKLKPNLLSVIHIKDFSSDSALTVPSIIIKQDITGSYLYVVREDNNKLIAHKVYVDLGMSYSDKTMILKGLSPGDKIIVEGYNQVSDGAEVVFNKTNVSPAPAGQ